MITPVKSEASTLIGLLGTVITAVILAALGFATPETAGESVAAAVASLAPLAAGLATRGAVWSRASVEDLSRQLGTAVGPVLGEELTGRLADLAKENGEDVVRAAVQRAVDLAGGGAR